MIDALIRWSLRSRAAVLACALIVSAWGIYTAVKTPVDVFPDLTAPTVTVLTEARGMAPSEVEAQVTYPIETALNGAPGVRRVRSSTTVGFSVVWCEFEWDADVLTARQIVNERLEIVADSLPLEVERPILAPISSIMGEVLFLGVTPDGASALETRTWVDAVLRRQLLAIPGVAQVIPIGGEARQFQVQLDPAKLDSHEVTVPQVAEALEAENRDIAAGFFASGGTESLVAAQGRLRGVADIESVVVSVHDRLPVTVHDLGEVVEGPAPARGMAAIDGRPGVILGVQKQPDANTLELTARIDALLDEVEAEMPAGMTLNRDLLRQADFIEVAVDNLLHELLLGGLLVVLIVGFFLVQASPTLITLTSSFLSPEATAAKGLSSPMFS